MNDTERRPSSAEVVEQFIQLSNDDQDYVQRKMEVEAAVGERTVDTKRFTDAVDHVFEHYRVFSAGPNLGYLLIIEQDEKGREYANIVEKHKTNLIWANTTILLPNAKKIITPVEYWLTHRKRRAVKGICFVPGAAGPEGWYNRWRKWPYLPIEGDCSKLLWHIKYIIAAGDEASYEYILNWCAHLIQKPTERCEVVLALRGPQGAGKGKFVNILGDLVRPHYYYGRTIKSVTRGDFNDQLEGIVLGFLDEVNAYTNEDDASILRSYISEPEIEIHAKYRKKMSYANYLHFIMAGNTEHFVRLMRDDRRFAVFQVSGERLGTDHPEYYQALDYERDNGGREAFMHFLSTRKIKDFNPAHFPQTQARAYQKRASLGVVDAWVLDLVGNGMMLAGVLDCPTNKGKKWDDDMVKVPQAAMYDSFQTYAKETRAYGSLPDKTSLTRRIVEMLEIPRASSGLTDRMRVGEGPDSKPVPCVNLPSRRDCVAALCRYFKMSVEQLDIYIAEKEVDMEEN